MFATLYAEDFGNMRGLTAALSPVEHIHAVGDIGRIEKIIDLRGFFPISASQWDWPGRRDYKGDAFKVFHVPLRNGIQFFYYGDPENASGTKKTNISILKQNQSRLDDIPLEQEDALSPESKKWASIAYAMTKNAGEKLFRAADGGSGYQSAEPVAILLTRTSSVIFISFGYSSRSRIGTGQLVMAYEFSRALLELKKPYHLYDTFAFDASTKNLFENALPIIGEAVKAAVGGN